MRTSPLPLVMVLSSLILVGCGSGAGSEGLAVDPPAPATKVGTPLVIRAEPLEPLAGEPEWEIQEVHGGGFKKSQGYQITYVAPPSAGTYHLVARAPRPDGTRMKFEVSVEVLADPILEPAKATLVPGNSLPFTVRMKGLPRNTVTWSVEEPEGGTITADGIYTAPSHPGLFHVVATSTLDKSVSVSAPVKVE